MSNTDTQKSPRYPLLFNPNARGRKGKKTLRYLMKNAHRFALYATQDEQDGIDLATKLAKEGEPIVIASGGDGTLNAILQGLKGSDTALGVFPSGTMNVFARELGIPVPTIGNSMQLDKALEVVDAGNIKEVDLFSVTGKGVEERGFLQMAGIGFDAQIIEQTDPAVKKKLGPLVYLASTVKVMGMTPPKLTLTTESGEVHQGTAILVGNGSYYGGQVKLFAEADNSDGLLDFIILKDSGYRLICDILSGITSKESSKNPAIEYVQTSAATVKSNIKIPLQLDGDLIGSSKEFTFSKDAKTLKVLAPTTPQISYFNSLVDKLNGIGWEC